ncbi:hypothetical protein RI845_00140 [Thalassotalea nanhaiensis]|uniref:Uncharacterized protein n=1 Tax=Thalassotalea nanhaiensis TaxID=3065648 RepID=A0ABY9TIQ5_9GAMM|nr:hypothetical protein RI845_00140 [Colwelliaceae bacterium SQ345]
MNQAILFNDDHIYIVEKQLWRFTGLLSGNQVNIYIAHSASAISQADKFDWEEKVEEWLEDNEPDENNEIWL